MRGLIPRGTISLILFGCLLAFALDAHAADVKVQCGSKAPFSSIGAALKVLNRAGPNNVSISGTCTENVVIRGFNRLTLIGSPGAFPSENEDWSECVETIP